MNINNPIPLEWSQYVTQSSVGLEVVPAVLYDTQTYTDNTDRSLTFFQRTNAAADLTNVNNGTLPNPQSFLLQAIRIYAKYTAAVQTTVAASIWNDLVLLVNTGIGRLQIGEKRYGPWPLWMFSAGSFVKGPLAGANSNYMGYMQLDGVLYGMFPHLMISPLQNFIFTMEWPSAAVDTSANLVLEVLFDGQMARAIQ